MLRHIAGLLLAVAVAVPVFGAAPGGGSGGVDWGALEKRLGSADFAERTMAQGELERLPFEQYDALRQHVRAQADPEVKARLEQAVTTMGCRAFLLGPPVSVDVKNAPLGEVAQALNKSMHGEYLTVDREGDELYTVKVEKGSLWEVLGQMHKQTPLRFGEAPDSHMVISPVASALPARGNQIPAAYGMGPFAATLARTNTQATGMGGSALNIGATFDPRVWILRVQVPLSWNSAVDSLNQDLASQRDANGTAMIEGIAPVTNLQFRAGAAAKLRLPENYGPMLTKASVTMRLYVVSKQEKVTVEDLPAKVQKPITWRPGAGNVRITALEKKDGTVTLTATVTQTTPPKQGGVNVNVSRAEMHVDVGEPSPIPNTPIMVRLVDKAGYVAQACTNPQIPAVTNPTVTLTLPTADGVDAVHLEVAWPVKVEEVTLPLEVKDVTLEPRRNGPGRM
jgi:hypothetical protein